uniref:Uncharacterized protein n=1 Tax=Ignisphaera aggregans TaxID=334771 RepID=A0A7C2VH52_9CREN
MTRNNTYAINIIFYNPEELELGELCKITFFRKVHEETVYENRELVERFMEDDDLFLSWLSSIATSRGYAVARALIKFDGTSSEALLTTIKPRYLIDCPYISRVLRIYVVEKLPTLEETMTQNSEVVNTQQGSSQETTGSPQLSLFKDLTNDELYVFYSPVKLLDTSKAEAIVIETERGAILAKLDAIPRLTETGTEGTAKRKTRKRKKRRKKHRKTRKKARASS